MKDRVIHPSIIILTHAASGLLFPSETDAPLTPFFWPQNESLSKEVSSAEAPSKEIIPKETSALSPDQLVQLADLPAETPIKSVKLEIFFRPATKQEEWHNEEEKAEVEKFKTLVKVIKENLDDVKVYRVGETKIDVYIVGKVEGGYAGLKTHVVET